MKYLLIIALTTLATTMKSQSVATNFEFIGNKVQVLRLGAGQELATGRLSSGETVKVGCYGYDCFFRIEYKGRTIQTEIEADEGFAVYEFDFGGDDDKEIVLVQHSEDEPQMVVLGYSKGNISLLLETDISPYKTVVSKNYLECFDETGLPEVAWHYYKGIFWEMTPSTDY